MKITYINGLYDEAGEKWGDGLIICFDEQMIKFKNPEQLKAAAKQLNYIAYEIETGKPHKSQVGKPVEDI